MFGVFPSFFWNLNRRIHWAFQTILLCCDKLNFNFLFSDCPIERVTVYGDRAEVTRRVTFEATASGQHEIIVSHLCSLGSLLHSFILFLLLTECLSHFSVLVQKWWRIASEWVELQQQSLFLKLVFFDKHNKYLNSDRWLDDVLNVMFVAGGLWRKIWIRNSSSKCFCCWNWGQRETTQKIEIESRTTSSQRKSFECSLFCFVFRRFQNLCVIVCHCVHFLKWK